MTQVRKGDSWKVGVNEVNYEHTKEHDENVTEKICIDAEDIKNAK